MMSPSFADLVSPEILGFSEKFKSQTDHNLSSPMSSSTTHQPESPETAAQGSADFSFSSKEISSGQEVNTEENLSSKVIKEGESPLSEGAKEGESPVGKDGVRKGDSVGTQLKLMSGLPPTPKSAMRARAANEPHSINKPSRFSTMYAFPPSLWLPLCSS